MATLGVNLPWVSHYSNGGWIFADMFKNGTPYQDGSLWLASPNFGSAYAVSGYALRFYDPTNSQSVGGDNVTVSGLTSADGNGYRTASVSINSASGNTGVSFSTAPVNASLMQPGHSLGTDWFAENFLAAIEPFSVIRTMQAQGPQDSQYSPNNYLVGVMASYETNWADRALITDKGKAEKGISFEDAVILANLTGKDIWVCVPIRATDTFITNMANLFRYGSDGTTPYTSYTHDPSTWTVSTTSWYPGLASGRKVYVELSNEIWNYDLAQNWAVNQATTEYNGGNPHHLPSDGSGQGYDYWVAWRTLKISTLFRAVWGDSAMQNTVRIVLANQGDWSGWARHSNMLDYITDVFVGDTYAPSVDGVPTGHPVSYHLHNISGSFYGHWGSPSTLTQAFDNLNTSLSTNGGLSSAGEYNCIQERIDAGSSMATTYGIKFSTYESGLETPPPSSGNLSDQADNDSRIQTYTESALNRFCAKSNADVNVYFWLAGDRASVDAGLGFDLNDTDTYRWRAINAIAATLEPSQSSTMIPRSDNMVRASESLAVAKAP